MGSKTNKKLIKIFEPSVGQEDINDVTDVLKTKWIGLGEQSHLFKKELAYEFGVSETRILLTNSCSSGLMALPHIFNIVKGDSVIMPTISFPSLANSFKRVGVDIKLTDVDKRSGNIRLEDFEHLVDKTTRAVIVTHYGGNPVELEKISKFCASNNIFLIEDAACAIKSFDSQNNRIGTYSDCALWSFDAMKTLTCGDGGMMIFRDVEKKEKASELLYLGLPSSEKSGLDRSSDKGVMWWEYDIKRAGSRDIINDIAASIGRTQLAKLDSFIQRRSNVAQEYRNELQSIKGLSILSDNLDCKKVSNYFFTIVSEQRNELAHFLMKKNIYTTFRYWPLHLTSLYKDEDKYKYKNANHLSNHALNIPIHQNLSDEDVLKIIESISLFYESV